MSALDELKASARDGATDLEIVIIWADQDGHTGTASAAAIDLAALREQNRKLREMLIVAHKAMSDVWMFCPYCTGHIAQDSDKHDPNCALAALLKE